MSAMSEFHLALDEYAEYLFQDFVKWRARWGLEEICWHVAKGKMMTDLLIIIGFIFGMMCVYVLGEVGCYRRGGDVYWWAKALDKYVPKRWK